MTNRELDAKVAVFMGWHEWTNFYDGDYEGEYPMFLQLDEMLAVYLDQGSHDFYFNPSTDIKAAFLVVDKLVEMGFYVDIGVDEYGAQVQLERLDGSWYVQVESIRGKDASEAICLAALKTKECKDE